MTYRQLQQVIEKMDDKQKDAEVIIHCDDIYEFYPIKDISFIEDEGVFDTGQPIINCPEKIEELLRLAGIPRHL